MSIVPLLVAGLAWGAPPTKKPTDAERGKELYERHCAACHGESGAGDGPAASALVVPVPDLRGKVDASPPSVKIVRFGRGVMPAFEASFDDADARRVLEHMAKAPDAPAPVDDAPDTDDDAEDPDLQDAQAPAAPEDGD